MELPYYSVASKLRIVKAVLFVYIIVKFHVVTKSEIYFCNKTGMFLKIFIWFVSFQCDSQLL
jgi:hypothetical protein